MLKKIYKHKVVLKGGGDEFFDTLMGMFVEPSQKVAKSLAEHVGSFFHAQLILNTIITILFMIWAYKRVKEGDMFEFKTAMGVV
ncbi:hypothetical protein C0158_09505, partial [Moraxella catarrhalis]|nr:hypothetical protein [Moraxella catarrhalis]